MNTIHDNIRWLVAALLLFALPAVAQVRDTLDFSVSERTFETVTVDGEAFNLYSYPDCDHIDQTGAPMLPVKYILLSVPYNAKDITVTGAGSYTQGTAGRRIYPAPVPIPTDGSVTEDPALVIDSAIYMANAYWPAHPAELVGEGFLMGEHHIVTVAVYPMLYNPIAARVRNYSRVRLTVSYTLGGTPANMLVRYDPELRQQERQEAMALVDNPSQVEAHAVPASAVQHMMQQNPDTASWPVPGYEYMVVTTRELAPAFKRLIALKQQKGYRAGVVCVENIVNDPLVQEGDKSMLPDSTFSYINDDAGKIRQYLKENWPYGTKYVLFGGQNVPFRYGFLDSINISNIHYMDKKIPTDLYFTNFHSNWNINNNDLYGEFKVLKQYGFDKYPDFFVGRLLSKNKAEILNYTNKECIYELNPGNGDGNYLKRAFYFQHYDMGPRYGKYEAQNVASHFGDIHNDTTLLEEPYPDIVYPKGADVINAMNASNYGFISMHTHGNPGHMTAYNDGEKLYSIQALESQYIMRHEQYIRESGNGFDCLTNSFYPNIMYSIACDVTPFDDYHEYFNSAECNFGNSYTCGKNYGGVAFLGNTRSGYVGKSANLETKFADAIRSGYYSLGKAEAFSKFWYDDKEVFYRIWIPMIHNLIGDPELQMWTDVPTNLDPIIIKSDNSISIYGLNVSDNMVVYAGCSDGLHQLMKSTKTDSITFSNVNPNSTVMVYSHNYLPYIAPLYLQNERVVRSQYVIANDVYAGRNVDTNRTAGDLTIAEGSEYEIETKGQVVLAPGFKVEKGALFSVTQSDY